MRKLLIVAGVVATVVLLTTQPAAAGGWAVTSLDAVPAPVADEPVSVGFTILQHGVSPVNIDDGVFVVVRNAAGDEVRSPARREGPDGHYVADVEFPSSGTFTWAVEQGEFGLFELGSIDVAPAGAPVAGGRVAVPSVEAASEPVLLRIVLPLVAVAGLGMLLFDLRSRRVVHRGMAG